MAEIHSVEKILDSLATTNNAIDDYLFTLNKLFIPIVFNHLESGAGVSFNYVPGFRVGLKEVMLKMKLDATACNVIQGMANLMEAAARNF